MSGHGQNATARNAWKGTIDRKEQTLYHGEGDLFTQLKQSGWKGESGKTYRLFVNQTGKNFVCPSCNANMTKYMAELNIQNLDVYLMDGTLYSYRAGSATPTKGRWK